MIKILVIKPDSDFKDGPDSVAVLFDSLKEVMRGMDFSFEINSYSRKIFFTVRIEEKYKDILEGQIYANWPDFEILEVPEFVPEQTENFAFTEMHLEHSDLFPLKTFSEFQSLPLINIFSYMNKLSAHEGIFYQLHIRPYDYKSFVERWRRDFTYRLKTLHNATRIFKRMFDYKFRSENLKHGYAMARKKNHEPLYQLDLTILCYAANAHVAKARLENFCKGFLNFETHHNEPEFHVHHMTAEQRTAYTQLRKSPKLRMTTAELATFFQFPRETDQVPNVFKVLSKKGQPPLDLPTLGNTAPDDLSLFATTNFRDIRETFGITYRDRERHMYIIGKSGSGKSKLQETLILEDIKKGKGVGVIDPHGDLVDNVLKYIPEHRVKDIVIFDPADVEFPIAFNPLEKVEPQYRIQVASGFIEIFKKLFGANWTPRLEHVLRFVVLALLDTEGATPMSILKMLTDREFRQRVIPQIQDSVVKNFWTNEFASWSERFDSEAIMPILNKIGQFLSNTQIRNIVCQQVNKFDMRRFMDDGKVVLMKLSKGILGDENSELIGSMIITKVYQAGMQRASIDEELRRPFYLYVDEFQNFATDTFGNILSEARKYKLSLTVGHQYIEQLNAKVKSTVFGNVGTIISFRVGPTDAQGLQSEFAPIFSARDIVNLAVQEIYLKMSINGDIKDAFSARTLPVPPPPEKRYLKEITENTRTNYAQPRDKVIAEIEGKEDKALELIHQLQSAEFEAPLL